jgi:hypothetical protein
MPKPCTFPTLFDEVKTVSISFLTKYNYLNANQRQSGTITWSRNGNKTDCISVRVNTQSEQPYIELEYRCNEAPVKYRVQLVSVPSNLGKGFVWYFTNTYFYHRSAFKGGMYKKQTQSKKQRYFDKTLSLYFRSDELFELLYKKHFKKQYAGKPTKKYLKLTQQIQKAESIPYHEIERALMS